MRFTDVEGNKITAEKLLAYLEQVDTALRRLEGLTDTMIKARESLGGKTLDGTFIERVDLTEAGLRDVCDSLMEAKGRLLGILPSD